MPKAALVIDYQNTHLTAARLFCPNKPYYEALIDPVLYAKQLERVKNANKRISDESNIEITHIEVFRGLPLAAKDPSANSRNIQQKRNWEAAAKELSIELQVMHRNLKYYEDGSVSEKGVDVMCALALVRLSSGSQYDTVILSSRDTDLCPALEEANRMGSSRIEAVKWVDDSNRSSWGSLKPDFKMWTTQLYREDFLKCIDPRDYSDA